MREYIQSDNRSAEKPSLLHTRVEVNPSLKLYAKKNRDDLRSIYHHEKMEFDLGKYDDCRLK
ncbi:hypothetical protein Pan161_60760 [Gimesia algae]|uniref:Uncharacterized protein n=1 Tax=Gimesia algae TaxID=2527971 RepID=A0A517VNA3_9PLAN|nr:hypothetical protein Pan161_60760 [Gimesia algae]